LLPAALSAETPSDPTPVAPRAALKGPDSGVWRLAISPDGKLLASGDWDGVVKLWDLTTGKEVATLKDSYPAGAVAALAFTRDGKAVMGVGQVRPPDEKALHDLGGSGELLPLFRVLQFMDTCRRGAMV
jgi:WD40 repeat protein